MSDSMTDLLKASPGQVAAVLGLGDAPARVWRPEELGAVFQHQMAAPVWVDLGALTPGAADKLKILVAANNLLLRSFRDLFQHPAPPLELLELVKDFAKLNRDQPESVLPTEVATVLYFLSIAAALTRCSRRITTLGDRQLREGFAWSLRQRWIDETARALLESASVNLPGGK
jgi:hypothetical protein